MESIWQSIVPIPTRFLFLNMTLPSYVSSYDALLILLTAVTIPRESMKSKFCGPVKTLICRYHMLPGGCARGDRCFYAHGEEELWKASKERRIKSNANNTSTSKTDVMQELRKKVFVGGLSPLVSTGDLWEFFEEKFGPVSDAIVIESLSGDRVQSRGFGFVTFKHEVSVMAAVEARYIALLGKKVEIKAAIPRDLIFLNIEGENIKFANEINKSIRAAEYLDSQVAWQNVAASCGQHVVHVQNMSATVSQYPTNDANDRIFTPHERVQRQPTSNLPCSWVDRLKKWLPRFLQEVSMRLREGEYYPLSSLKGDFRATCGLELDHASLGYQKLSDFIRSMPELCRMKIVPVGNRGPATHIVVLPPIPKRNSAFPMASQIHLGTVAGRKPQNNIYRSGLVKEGRSYAAVTAEPPEGAAVRPFQGSAGTLNGSSISLYQDTGLNLEKTYGDKEGFSRLISDSYTVYPFLQRCDIDNEGKPRSIKKPDTEQLAMRPVTPNVLLWDELYAAPFACNESRLEKVPSPYYENETNYIPHHPDLPRSAAYHHTSVFSHSLSSFLFGRDSLDDSWFNERNEPGIKQSYDYKVKREESPQSVLSSQGLEEGMPSSDCTHTMSPMQKVSCLNSLHAERNELSVYLDMEAIWKGKELTTGWSRQMRRTGADHWLQGDHTPEDSDSQRSAELSSTLQAC